MCSRRAAAATRRHGPAGTGSPVSRVPTAPTPGALPRGACAVAGRCGPPRMHAVGGDPSCGCSVSSRAWLLDALSELVGQKRLRFEWCRLFLAVLGVVRPDLQSTQNIQKMQVQRRDYLSSAIRTFRSCSCGERFCFDVVLSDPERAKIPRGGGDGFPVVCWLLLAYLFPSQTKANV